VFATEKFLQSAFYQEELFVVAFFFVLRQRSVQLVRRLYELAKFLLVFSICVSTNENKRVLCVPLKMQK
jgi:hypothetical protein